MNKYKLEIAFPAENTCECWRLNEKRKALKCWKLRFVKSIEPKNLKVVVDEVVVVAAEVVVAEV